VLRGYNLEKKYYGHKDFYKIIDQIKELHSEKNKQYATTDDPLGNFRRASALCGKLLNPDIDNKPLAYALILMSKQVDGVYEMLGESKEGTVEEIEDKLMDIACYSILSIILRREGK